VLELSVRVKTSSKVGREGQTISSGQGAHGPVGLHATFSCGTYSGGGGGIGV
jgi:hypothetical protein